MSQHTPSFFARISLAFVAFFRALGNGDFAGVVRDYPKLPSPAPNPAPEPPKPEPPKALVERVPSDAALQLLSIFQREGRLLDFLTEDMDGFSDDEIGTAARVVHRGARNALKAHFEIEPVRDEAEDSTITIETLDPKEVRLTGNVTGDAPFTGTLTHRGYRVTKVDLPKLTEDHDMSVLARAELELP